MMAVKDYDGIWHRISTTGTDTYRTLCGETIRSDSWNNPPSRRDIARPESGFHMGEDICGECWYG